ncbi:DUF3750 domain-containing protein [Desertibaculum subflavum]|uniref:DUF3750 domain-containing protein n=1 Tax=Desertibaculum subflavum TaxID=2268458 RepID=UPI000E663680
MLASMRLFRFLLLPLLLVFLLPLGAHAAWWMAHDHPASWSAANWSSSGVLPAADASREAQVLVFAARTGRWKGIFAHHSWIVLKPAGAADYVRYDKVGWGRPVRKNGWAADALWYGNRPELIGKAVGAEAEALIPRIEAAIAAYPHNRNGGYNVWPGPNSNTFVAHVLAQVPELDAVLPPTAIGKDWTEGLAFGASPSGTGFRFSIAGLFGVTLGWVEGVEVNLLGAVLGLDIRRPALKLPGFGRLGVPVV